jgi:hypothetical protein
MAGHCGCDNLERYEMDDFRAGLEAAACHVERYDWIDGGAALAAEIRKLKRPETEQQRGSRPYITEYVEVHYEK